MPKTYERKENDYVRTKKQVERVYLPEELADILALEVREFIEMHESEDSDSDKGEDEDDLSDNDIDNFDGAADTSSRRSAKAVKTRPNYNEKAYYK